MKAIYSLIWTLYILILTTGTAHAYLDPGSGSMLLQIILGGLAGLAVTLKIFWNRLVVAFRFGKGKESDSTNSRET